MNLSDENELLKSVEDGEWETIPNIENELKRYQLIAKNKNKKAERINIRLATQDLMGLQKSYAGRFAVSNFNIESLA